MHAPFFGSASSRRKLSVRHSARRSWRRTSMFERLEIRSLMDAAGFVQSNLASDIPGFAAHTDADLQNPWGATETPQGEFRAAANGAGNSPLFNAQGKELGQAVTIPAPPSDPAGTLSTPNGVVTNTTNDFVITQNGRSAPASIIYSAEDGTITAWNPAVNKTQAILASDQSATGAVYKLLALGSNSQGNFLFATDFHNNKIDVFDKNFQKVPLGANGFDTFTDPNEPAGFAPFGIKDINGTLFVSYAKQLAPDNTDDQEGPGNGFIDTFDTSGHFLGRFASGTAAGGTLTQLNSPIGMAVAPKGFGPKGEFSGALLVGNFGDSTVSAFDMTTGAFLGQLSDAQGNPLVLNGGFPEADHKGLWGIAFGNGHGGAATDALFFFAGVNAEADGLFGEVTMKNNNNNNNNDRDRGQNPDEQQLEQDRDGRHGNGNGDGQRGDQKHGGGSHGPGSGSVVQQVAHRLVDSLFRQLGR